MNQKAVDALLARKAIRRVAVQLQRARKLMERARKELATAAKIVDLSEDIAYKTAYDAVFGATLALMAVHGYRLGNAEQRKAAVEFCRAALPAGLDAVLAAYDKMRQRRNDLAYDLATVSRTDAEEAMKQAGLLIEAIAKQVDQALASSRKKP